jgi:hypothetical protein
MDIDVIGGTVSIKNNQVVRRLVKAIVSSHNRMLMQITAFFINLSLTKKTVLCFLANSGLPINP